MRKLIGYILLAFVILINVISSIYIQYMTRAGIKPFAFSYINYSFLAILILVTYIKNKLILRFKKQNNEQKNELNHEDIKEEDKINSSEVLDKIITENKSHYKAEFHLMCIILMIFWYFANSFYNLGLTLTSVTSSNSLSNISILFILIGKMIFIKVSCSVYKLIALILCVGGVTCIALFDVYVKKSETEQKESIMGDIYLIIGAAFYALYSIYLKYYSKKHKLNFDMMEIFGYIGLYNLIIIPFFLLILHFSNLEVLQIPSWMDLFLIFINALIAGLISDLCQSYCITLLSPHIVSFGLTLSIPLSYLYDFLAGKITFDYLYLFGSLLLFVSFSFIFYDSYKKIKAKQNKIIT